MEKQQAMDQDSINTELCLGLNLGSGIVTRSEDQNYDPPKTVNGPPLQLNLFPLTSVIPRGSCSPALLPASRTLPWERTSPVIDSSCSAVRSTGDAEAAIHPGSVSRRFDDYKLPASNYHEELGAINVSSSNSTVDSNAINSERTYPIDFKGKRVPTEELKNERVCAMLQSDVEEEGCSTKKKLRLSKEQSAVLEESFSKNKAPELHQKEALARKLNLTTLQVEVWFQNKRTRTKLKQTEMQCEILKRCNESLKDENIKLQKELQELRSLKTASPLWPATTDTVCSSCGRVEAAHNSKPSTLVKPKQFL